MIQEIDYKDVIELGFKRHETVIDNNFFNEYGFNWFLVILKINNQIYFDWDCNTRHVKMVRVDKDQTIKGTIQVQNLAHLVELLCFWGKFDPLKHLLIESKCILSK